MTQSQIREWWSCDPMFPPTVRVQLSGRFEQSAPLSVSQAGARGLTLHGRRALPDGTYPIELTLPGAGTLHTEVDLRQELDGAEAHTYSARFTRSDALRSRKLGRYLVAHGPPVSFATLREQGLWPGHVADLVRFDLARTEAERSQVMALRDAAYGAAGGGMPQVDAFDQDAEVLVASIHGRAIASLRMTSPEPGGATVHGGYVELPDSLPPRDQVVEVTRVCTHPDYRSSDLLVGLFRHCAVAVLARRRRWILGNAPEDSLGLYLRVGCRATDVSFVHHETDRRHVVFVADVPAIMAGRTNPLVWLALYDELWDFLVRTDLHPARPQDRARVAALRLLRPVTGLMGLGGVQ